MGVYTPAWRVEVNGSGRAVTLHVYSGIDHDEVLLAEPHHVRRALALGDDTDLPALARSMQAGRLFRDATGAGATHTGYTRSVQSDTAAPNPPKPVGLYKACACCPGGTHPCGSVMSPNPFEQRNTIVWASATEVGIEHNVPFRFVHQEAHPPEFDTSGGRTVFPYIYDRGFFEIEGWDGLPPLTFADRPGPGSVGYPRAMAYRLHWVRLFTSKVSHDFRVVRQPDGTLRVGDATGTVYTTRVRESGAEPWDLYREWQNETRPVRRSA